MRTLITSLIAAVLIAILGFIILGKVKQKIDYTLSAPAVLSPAQPSPTPTDSVAREEAPYLFVPYWAVGPDDDFKGYDKLIYYGVPVDEHGLETDDLGYTNLPAFVKETAGKEIYLTIRMIDSQTNFAILKNAKEQQTIIEQSVALAKKEHFKGIVLNFEVSALPFDSLIEQIRNFNRTFYQSAKKQHLQYAVTAYGDSFYRVRPFNIADMGKNADRVFIMAYDFHKAKGNPGPNFPLQGADTYGYDFEEMVSSFSQAVAANKLTVVFGMYGYDWPVDDKGVSQGAGSPVSLKQIKNQFLDTCKEVSCSWKRDSKSAEIELTYTDKDHLSHIVWFEDEESVKRKKAFLSKRGIGSTAFWAYSYF